jgi:hypothetical protein
MKTEFDAVTMGKVQQIDDLISLAIYQSAASEDQIAECEPEVFELCKSLGWDPDPDADGNEDFAEWALHATKDEIFTEIKIRLLTLVTGTTLMGEECSDLGVVFMLAPRGQLRTWLCCENEGKVARAFERGLIVGDGLDLDLTPRATLLLRRVGIQPQVGIED